MSHSSTSIICPRSSNELTADDGSSAVRLMASSASVSNDVIIAVVSRVNISSNTLLVYVRICVIVMHKTTSRPILRIL